MVGILSRVRAVDVRATFGRASQVLVETIYPKTCAGCDARGHWLCAYCDASEAGIGSRRCDRCGVEPQPRSGCWCAGMTETIVVARSAYAFHGCARAMVHRTKYGGERARTAWMADRMMPLLADFGRIDGLVPVPLHPRKLHQRGFNQADELARAIGGAMALPVMPMLVRTKPTVPQVTLSQAEGSRNVSDAFALDKGWTPVPGGRYVLVDDVRTSGATLAACASVLHQATGAQVCALTFAVAT